MKLKKYEIVQKTIIDTSEAMKGKDIFYHCKKCDDFIPSVPKSTMGCECGAVFIDKEYFRLAIDDYNNFEVVLRIKN